jgi:hypothetical protein
LKITDSGDEWIKSSGIDFPDNGVVAGDKFNIGESTTKILNEAVVFTGISIEIDGDFDKYMARVFKAILPLTILNDICNIEKAHWFESYDDDGNVTIKVYREENYTSSGVSLTEANYRRSFKIERPSNSYSKVYVYGNPYFSIEAEAIDPDNDSPLQFTIIDAGINTQVDAQAVANGKLDYLKNIRPSIVLDLYGDYTALEPGQLITATLTRPSVTLTEIPIRRMDFKQETFHDDLQIRVYIGMGNSPVDETLAENMNMIEANAWKGQTDLLNSPVASGVPVISHGALLNLSSDDHVQYHNDTRGDARYLKLAGGTMSGAIAMGSQKITGLAAGSANGDALRYEQLASYLPLASLETTPTNGATTKAPNSDWAYDVEDRVATLETSNIIHHTIPILAQDYANPISVSYHLTNWQNLGLNYFCVLNSLAPSLKSGMTRRYYLQLGIGGDGSFTTLPQFRFYNVGNSTVDIAAKTLTVNPNFGNNRDYLHELSNWGTLVNGKKYRIEILQPTSGRILYIHNAQIIVEDYYA